MAQKKKHSSILVWIIIPVLLVMSFIFLLSGIFKDEPDEDPAVVENTTAPAKPKQALLPFTSADLQTFLAEKWSISFEAAEKGERVAHIKGCSEASENAAVLRCDIYENEQGHPEWVEFMVDGKDLSEEKVDQLATDYFISVPLIINEEKKISEAEQWISKQIAFAKSQGNTVSSVIDPVKYTMYGTTQERTLIVTQGPPPPIVILNGQQLSFDVAPIIEDGRTLVPLRAIFEAMGATVTWDEATRTAIGIKGNIRVELPLGSTEPTINGNMYKLDVPGRIVKGRTLAPLRFVSEAFGGKVNWDVSTNIITITTDD